MEFEIIQYFFINFSNNLRFVYFLSLVKIFQKSKKLSNYLDGCKVNQVTFIAFSLVFQISYSQLSQELRFYQNLYFKNYFWNFIELYQISYAQIQGIKVLIGVQNNYVCYYIILHFLINNDLNKVIEIQIDYLKYLFLELMAVIIYFQIILSNFMNKYFLEILHLLLFIFLIIQK